MARFSPAAGAEIDTSSYMGRHWDCSDCPPARPSESLPPKGVQAGSTSLAVAGGIVRLAILNGLRLTSRRHEQENSEIAADASDLFIGQWPQRADAINDAVSLFGNCNFDQAKRARP